MKASVGYTKSASPSLTDYIGNILPNSSKLRQSLSISEGISMRPIVKLACVDLFPISPLDS
ncbi:unnamed protein product [Dovyalis caffra]|uniref:Uncharacterized protein n=1 Tax=Dovyalis caffra TaxID=77055 RepID=A0AAV1RI65_9ROSI|nr:unnamed protein product [Dovyalis caffra]